jgi:cyclase
MKTQYRFAGIAVVVAALLSFALPAAAQQAINGFVPPAGWLPPPLHPAGVELVTKELSPGVYALLSPQPPVDNAGFVVGENGVLVIDAHFGAAMADQVQAAIRKVTDKPILYLVNTNAHGDHTFGNHAFPATTKIVAHSKTAQSMGRFEEEKALLLPTVNGDKAFLDGAQLRLPDITFEESLRIDLGGIAVELHHFGHGNTPGDTVVYVPEAKTAWTGNLVLGAYTIPWAIEGGTRAYLQTIARFAASLDVETIVGGHAPITSAAILGTYLRYLGGHIEAVQGAIRDGLSIEETLAALPLGEAFLPPADSPMAPARPLMQGINLWNVKKTYQELSGS